jgi:hypothetical protein
MQALLLTRSVKTRLADCAGRAVSGLPDDRLGDVLRGIVGPFFAGIACGEKTIGFRDAAHWGYRFDFLAALVWCLMALLLHYWH